MNARRHVATAVLALAAIPVGAACGAAAELRWQSPLTHPPVATAVPAPRHYCTAWVVDGQAVVTLMASDPIGCDVLPPERLHLIYPPSTPACADGAFVYRDADVLICDVDY